MTVPGVLAMEGLHHWPPEQTASINKLVGLLQQQYGLDDHDIYKHDTISYKTQGEGDGLYVPGAAAAGGVQQPSGPTR